MKKINRSTDLLSKALERQLAISDTRNCLGCVHEGTLVTSLDGTIIDAAPTAEHILNTQASLLKGREIREFCALPETYDDIRRQTIHDGRVLNRSLLMLAGAGEAKARQHVDTDHRIEWGQPTRPCVSGLRGSAIHGRTLASIRTPRYRRTLRLSNRS
jgi:PAS domain-containing protein